MPLQKFAEFAKVQAYMYLNSQRHSQPEDEKWPLIFLLWGGGGGKGLGFNT